MWKALYTDAKNPIFLIYKEIQSEAVAKHTYSYIRKDFLIYEEMRKYISPYMRRPLVIYDFLQLLHSEFPLYMRKILLSFLSVHRGQEKKYYILICLMNGIGQELV